MSSLMPITSALAHRNRRPDRKGPGPKALRGSSSKPGTNLNVDPWSVVPMVASDDTRSDRETSPTPYANATAVVPYVSAAIAVTGREMSEHGIRLSDTPSSAARIAGSLCCSGGTRNRMLPE